MEALGGVGDRAAGHYAPASLQGSASNVAGLFVAVEILGPIGKTWAALAHDGGWTLEGFGLRGFRHAIDGKTYMGWYRVVSAHDLEVMGVGMLERVWFRGVDPEPVARSVLEDFIRGRLRNGELVPALQDAMDTGEGSLLETRLAPQSFPR